MTSTATVLASTPSPSKAKAKTSPKKKAAAAKKKVDKNKPRNPLSAYNLYYKIERRRIIFGENIDFTLETVQAVRRECKSHAAKPRRHHRKSEGGIGFQALTQKITTGWKAIDPKIKAILDQVSQEDREEHARLTKIYKAKLQKEQEQQQQQEEAAAAAKQALPTPVSPMSIEKAILEPIGLFSSSPQTSELLANSATVSLTDDSSSSSSSSSMEEEEVDHNTASSSMELEPLPALYSLVDDKSHEDHDIWTKLLNSGNEDAIEHGALQQTASSSAASAIPEQESMLADVLSALTGPDDQIMEPSSRSSEQHHDLDEIFPNHIQFYPVDCTFEDIAF